MRFKAPKITPRVWLILFLIALNASLGFFLFKKNAAAEVSTNQTFLETEQLKSGDWDLQKLVVFFKGLARDKGAEYAYHALVQSSSQPDFPSNVDVHLLGHAVGDELYKQEGISGIKVCSQDLRNACSHSIVVGYLLEHGIDSLPIAADTCHQAPGGINAYFMCIHGLGHGVLAFAGYDMHQAVIYCDKTGTPENGKHEVAECIGGVTMEMMSGIHDPVIWNKQKLVFFDPKDPLAPCDSGFIPKEYLSYCYIYLTPHLFEAAGANMPNPGLPEVAKAMTYCLKLKVGDPDRSTCLDSFGKEFVPMANARNIQSVVSMGTDQLKLVDTWCQLEPAEGVPLCIASAVNSLYWGGENPPTVSIRFCSVITDEKLAGGCLDKLLSLVSYYKQNDQQAQKSFCEEVPASYQTKCKSSLSLN